MNDIATLDMVRTIAVTEVQERYGTRYAVTLLLNGRPTDWDSRTQHHSFDRANANVRRFAKTIEEQFAKIVAVDDINARNLFTDASLWDYVFNVSDNPNVRARTLRCCFDDRRRVVS